MLFRSASACASEQQPPSSRSLPRLLLMVQRLCCQEARKGWQGTAFLPKTLSQAMQQRLQDPRTDLSLVLSYALPCYLLALLPGASQQQVAAAIDTRLAQCSCLDHDRSHASLACGLHGVCLPAQYLPCSCFGRLACACWTLRCLVGMCLLVLAS